MRVMPCTTSVASTTAKAVSTTTSRCGKFSGRMNAVASVTRPRIPHQPASTPCRHVAVCSRPRLRRYQAMPRLKANIMTRRETMTIAETMHANVTASRRCSPLMPPTMRRACRPIIRNASTLSTNTTMVHTA